MNEFKLADLFSTLESSAKKFNATSDIANQSLLEAELRLVNLNIGIEIWHDKPLAKTDQIGGLGVRETRSELIDLLGFSRAEGKWCFVVKRIKHVQGFYEEDERSSYSNTFLEAVPKPLLKESRSLRISALEELPDFLTKIAQHLHEKTQRLTDAVSQLQT